MDDKKRMGKDKEGVIFPIAPNISLEHWQRYLKKAAGRRLGYKGNRPYFT